MTNRTLAIVAALTVVLVVLAFMAQERPSSPTVGDSLFLPTLAEQLDAIEEIRITKAANESVATLRRLDSGWVVAEKDAFPADVGVIRTALLALSEAQIVEAMTSNPDFYDRLGVTGVDDEASGGTAVELVGGSVDVPVVVLGATEGTSYRYARLADEAQSMLIDRDPEVPRETSQWLRADLFDVRGTRMQRVVITHADGETVTISKAAPEQTNFSVDAVPEGSELQYPGVANVIGNALQELKLEDVMRDGGSEETVAVTEFMTFDGLTITAQSLEIDGEQWLRLTAGFDAAQAVEFASEPVEQGELSQAAEDSGNPQAEAETINETVGGWLFRIPSFKQGQITRRMDDLISEIEAPEDESELE